MKWAFYFDASQCSGCKTCQVACKDKHNLPVGLRWRNVYEIAGGQWHRKGDKNWISGVHSYNISLSCNHCEEPICMKKCPNKAIYKKEDGLVLIDEKRCMGCEYCKWACPYGALHLHPATGKMTKCTFCNDYIQKGMLPSCVTSCPMRVLEAGDLEKLKAKPGINNQTWPLPPENITKPALAIQPHKSATQKVKWKIINREEVRND